MMNSEHIGRQMTEQLLKTRDAVNQLEHDTREGSKKTDAKIKMLNDRIKHRMDSREKLDSSDT